jgi:hypothetical protein
MQEFRGWCEVFGEEQGHSAKKEMEFTEGYFWYNKK